MNPISQRASAFRKSVLELRLLSDPEIDEVLEQSSQLGLSPIEILVKKGLVTPSEIDVIDLLARADEAMPGYELLSLIGRGGMGVVYRARQKALNRIVALKTVLANKATNKQALLRFEREALTIAQLSHPNIVNPLDFGQHDGRFYLAMELVEGEDLDAYINKRQYLPEWAAWGIARQIASGLLHATRAGVIHRDIKPANILLVKPPEGYALRPGLPMAKISDFGLAILNSEHVVPQRLTSEDARIGSPNYMAPEQFESLDCDTRADIYALGATVFHMLVGHAPWSGKSMQQIVLAKIQKESLRISDYRPDLSAESVALLVNMMEPRVERRIANYDQLMSAMAGLSEDSNSTVPVRRSLPAATATNDEPTQEISKFQAAETQPIVTQQIGDQTPIVQTPIFGRRRTLWLATAGIVSIAAMATSAWFMIKPSTLELVESNDQSRLFDGQSVYGPEITQLGGGWAAREGRLVHESGSLGALSFQIPDWNMFAFEAIVENVTGHSITVQFAAKQTDGKGPRAALLVSNDRAQIGTLLEWRSDFAPSSKELQLDPDRSAHAIRIERRTAEWVAIVDDLEVGSVNADSLELFEVTLAVRKIKENVLPASNLDNPRGNAAFSEILVTRLQVKSE